MNTNIKMQKIKPKILIAENERIIAIDIKNSLHRMGCEVLEIVSSGEEVMRKVKEEKPDLILMDITLDGSLDGIETAEIISTKYDIPVIYLTAYSDRETLQRAKITEPYGFLIKPFDSREVEIAIEMAFIKRGVSFDDSTESQSYTIFTN
jgi:AmiR/NasT family two-component response regulator